LSQSRESKFAEDHSADLSALDIILALLLHALILTLIGMLVWWKGVHHEEPLKRIEVMMISAKELSQIEQQAKRKARPVKKEAAKTKPRVEPPKPKPKPKPRATPKKPPVPKVSDKPKPKPAARPTPKPAPKPKAKAAAKKKVDENFDPFAPVASSTDRSKSTAKKASTSRPDIANLQGQQLSKNEIERYIALMQAAVQDQWKVAANAGDVNDPLVEMELNQRGEVVSVKILESSGSETMDASLIRAIHAAAPFQVPRKQFEYFRVNKIRFHPL